MSELAFEVVILALLLVISFALLAVIWAVTSVRSARKERDVAKRAAAQAVHEMVTLRQSR